VEEIRRASLELDRLDVLLVSAIGSLQASFHTVASGAGALARQAPRSDCAGGEDPSERARVAAALDSGIRALQFEDMATQLIRRVRERIAAVGHAIEAGDLSDLRPREVHSVADRGTALDFGINDGAADVELF